MNERMPRSNQVLLGLDLCVEPDELFVVELSVSVEVVASNQIDRLLLSEAKFLLKDTVRLFQGHDPVSITVVFRKTTPDIRTPALWEDKIRSTRQWIDILRKGNALQWWGLSLNLNPTRIEVQRM